MFLIAIIAFKYIFLKDGLIYFYDFSLVEILIFVGHIFSTLFLSYIGHKVLSQFWLSQSAWKEIYTYSLTFVEDVNIIYNKNWKINFKHFILSIKGLCDILLLKYLDKVKMTFKGINCVVASSWCCFSLYRTT